MYGGVLNPRATEAARTQGIRQQRPVRQVIDRIEPAGLQTLVGHRIVIDHSRGLPPDPAIGHVAGFHHQVLVNLALQPDTPLILSRRPPCIRVVSDGSGTGNRESSGEKGSIVGWPCARIKLTGVTCRQCGQSIAEGSDGSAARRVGNRAGSSVVLFGTVVDNSKAGAKDGLGIDLIGDPEPRTERKRVVMRNVAVALKRSGPVVDRGTRDARLRMYGGGRKTRRAPVLLP